MGERIASDNPAVPSFRGQLVRRGGTRRPAVALPVDARDQLPETGPVRVVVDGQERSAPVNRHDDTRAIAGAYDNDRLARERSGPDRLAAWVEANDLDFGRSVVVDVLAADRRYGLRKPGQTVVYETMDGPADSLRRIAEDVDG